MECIILAGGLGTRLQGVIGAMPKCMALVAGRPFLFYLFRYLSGQHCSKVILSLGFKHEIVESWLRETSWNFEIETVIEKEALGTGGGIALALSRATAEHVFVVNGDTLFGVDLEQMLSFHLEKKAAATLALKALSNFERYGVVKTGNDNCIQSFEEKKQYAEGLINGGIYILAKCAVEQKIFPEKWSFEKDYLERFVSERTFYGFRSDTYFIDIGVPEDYNQAQKDFTDNGTNKSF